MLGFECVELEAAVPALIPSWSCFLWHYVILSFHVYGNGLTSDGQSSSTMLWRLQSIPQLQTQPREEQIQGQHSGVIKRLLMLDVFRCGCSDILFC